MKKKSICGILLAAMLCSLCPSAAFAAEEPLTTLTKALDFRDVEDSCQAEDGTWEWDAFSQVLTINNLRIEVPTGKLEEKAAILLPAESTLEIEGGHNKIYSRSFHCSAVYCEGELYVSGDGYLEIETTSYGASAFYVKEGPLVFEEKVEIEVDPAGYIIYMEYVKGKDAVLTICENASITFPDSATDRNITLTHKSSVKYTKDWLDYAEIHDYENRTVSLVDVSKKPKKNQRTETTIKDDAALTDTEAAELPGKDEYHLTIGNPEIYKNNELAYTADVAPYLSNGYTMLPLRALLDVTNPDLEIKWNEATGTMYTFFDGKMLSIKPGAASCTRASERITLSTPAETKDGRIFISLRDWMNMLEIDSSQLNWDNNSQTVIFSY